MRILWHSVAPWVGTGYGQQTEQALRRIKADGHDLALSAFYGQEYGLGEWEGILVYPTDHTRLGKANLRKWAQDWAQGGPVDSVQIVTLMDAWTWISPSHGGPADFDGLRIAAWLPVDHNPCPPAVVSALNRYRARPIAMSQFGFAELMAEGLDPLYVPHGIDTGTFAPNREEGLELREQNGIAADAFVIGMVANNQGNTPPRKAFPQVFQAFAEFRRRHEDAVLYVHAEVMGRHDGLMLPYLAEICGIPKDAIFAPPQDRYMAGAISSDQLAGIYNMFDVLASPSYGEGFGIPIVEAQACGVPVIVTDWTSMTELCGAGWLVDGDPWFDPMHGSFFKAPALAEIVDRFEQAYEARGTLAEKAREFAVQYDADRVYDEFWRPALKTLEEKGAEPKPNRAQRRKKQRKKVKA